MNECTCPYCHKTMQDPDDAYEPGMKYDFECPHCNKYFIFEVDYIRTYSESKADCLNGGEHDYQKTKTYPEEFAVMECTMCGDRRTIQ